MKVKQHLLLIQTFKEMKEDFGVVKLNMSNLHKTEIPRAKSTELLKNRSSMLIKTVLCITPYQK